MNERRCTSEEWIAHQSAMQLALGAIADLEDKIAAFQAEQVRLTAMFVDARVAFDDEHGFLSGPAQYRGMVAEIAIAKRISVTSAASFMDDAWHLAKHLPLTTSALADGRIGLSAARAIAHETVVIDDPESQALADELLADEAADLLPGKVRPIAEQRVAEIDPDAALQRTVRERADRHLQLSPAGSGMAWLNAYLPAEHATAAYTAVHDHAKALRAAGDPRTTGHLMCDTLVERLTGVDTGAIPSQINVVMTDATLLGMSDDPAHLVGGGPLAAPHARELATNGHAWLRRFLTDPVDGSLTHGDPRRRRFDGSLRDLVIARDQHCQGIQCGTPDPRHRPRDRVRRRRHDHPRRRTGHRPGLSHQPRRPADAGAAQRGHRGHHLDDAERTDLAWPATAPPARRAVAPGAATLATATPPPVRVGLRTTSRRCPGHRAQAPTSTLLKRVQCHPHNAHHASRTIRTACASPAA